MSRSITIAASLLILSLAAAACGGAASTTPAEALPTETVTEPTAPPSSPTPAEEEGMAESPTPDEGEESKTAAELYTKSPWWPYLSAHTEVESPPDLAGGPITLQINQDQAGANWVFPGPRALDPTIFGTEENPKAQEVPPILLGAPMKVRKTQEDGTFTTNVPTPFGDKFASTQGSLELSLVDATATDGATTKDKINLVASFQAPKGQGTYRVEVNKPASHGWIIPTGGGVVTNFIQHGVTKWGTQLMPTEYSYASFWGLGNIYYNDELVAENRLVHGMLTEFVRQEPYDLAFDQGVNPQARHFHLMIPPFTPKGQQKPVPTGFELPNGKEQPFFHVMFPDISAERVSASRGGVLASPSQPDADGNALPWTSAEEIFIPRTQNGDPQQRKPYQASPWWPYLSAHAEVEQPPQILGGPIQLEGIQDSGGANWVFPGPRELDPTIFGREEHPKATEGPPLFLGAPMKVRKAQEDGSFVTNVPTPFSDKFASTEGSVRFNVIDATAMDGAATQDQIEFEATFQAPQNQGTYRVVVNKPAPHGWVYPTGGGVVTNFIQHGITRWGTQLMPTEYSYMSFWGLGDIYLDGELVDENRVIHAMLTENVRKEPYDLVFDEGVNPNGQQLHLMIPPFTPKGVQDPVTSGFELPNGKEQPFFHVMFPGVELSGGMMGSNENDSSMEESKEQEVDRVIKVTAKSYEFDPGQISIRKGETVKFVVTTPDIYHTFTLKESEAAEEDIFNLKVYPEEPAEIVHTFEEEGELYLYCIPHEGLGMTGSITVTP